MDRDPKTSQIANGWGILAEGLRHSPIDFVQLASWVGLLQMMPSNGTGNRSRVYVILDHHYS